MGVWAAECRLLLLTIEDAKTLHARLCVSCLFAPAAIGEGIIGKMARPLPEPHATALANKQPHAWAIWTACHGATAKRRQGPLARPSPPRNCHPRP